MIGVRTRISIILRAAIRLAARPTMGKAIFCSFLLHVGTLSATYLWSSPSRQFSVAGQRNAIHLEAVFAKQRPRRPAEVRVEVQARPIAISDERPSRPPPLTAANVSLRRLQAPSHDRSIEMVQGVSQDVPVENEDVHERLAGTPPRRVHARSDSAMERPEVPVHRSRHVDAAPAPVPRVAIQQVAGVDEKTLPDFAGNRPPSYPSEAIRNGVEGTVVLRLHISDTGRVERVEVFESSGFAVLDDEAVAAVSGWQGRPARRRGEAVATVELLPVRFRLGR